MKKLKNEPLALALLLALVAALSIFWAGQKSGYFVDEGMTLYLANGNYTGAVTSRPEGTIQDFLKEYVLRDSLPATAANLVEMLKQLAGAGNYSQQGSVAWYDAARALLQGRRVWMEGSELFGGEVGIGERVSLVSLGTARRFPCISVANIPVSVLTDMWGNATITF